RVRVWAAALALLVWVTAGITEANPVLGLGLVSLAGRSSSGEQPLAAKECEETGATTSDRITLAQSGCCSHHQGVCGCGGDGRTLCFGGSVRPNCHCNPTPPPAPSPPPPAPPPPITSRPSPGPHL